MPHLCMHTGRALPGPSTTLGPNMSPPPHPIRMPPDFRGGPGGGGYGRERPMSPTPHRSVCACTCLYIAARYTCLYLPLYCCQIQAALCFLVTAYILHAFSAPLNRPARQVLAVHSVPYLFQIRCSLTYPQTKYVAIVLTHT